MKKLTFVLDVDGVLTDGTFLYDSNGKAYKKFGPEDADALKMLSPYCNIVFCSADKRGFPITEKRVNDMGFEVHNIKARDRKKWVADNFGWEDTIYMGDGLVDIPCLEAAMYSYVPANGAPLAKQHCNKVLECGGGHGAVAEAVYDIAARYFELSYIDLLKEAGYDV